MMHETCEILCQMVGENTIPQLFRFCASSFEDAARSKAHFTRSFSGFGDASVGSPPWEVF